MGNLSAEDKLRFLQDYNSDNVRKLAPVAAYLVVVMVTGFTGNILTCYIYATKLKKTTANCFILWLAVLDTMSCAIGLPFEIYDLLHEYFFDMPAVCRLMRFFSYLTLVSSVVTLVAIALDRYYKICRPLCIAPISNTKYFIFGSLSIGILTSWPTIFLFGRIRHETSHPEVFGYGCSLDDSVVQHKKTTIYFGLLISAILFCAVCLLLFYACVGITVRNRSRKTLGEVVTTYASRYSDRSNSTLPFMAGNSVETNPVTIVQLTSPPTDAGHSGPRYKVYKATFTCVAITAAFLVCFGPTLILMICRTLVPNFEETFSEDQYVVYSFFVRSYFLTNAINPIMYGYLNDEYRKHCVCLLGRLKTKITDILLSGQLFLTKGHCSCSCNDVETEREDNNSQNY